MTQIIVVDDDRDNSRLIKMLLEMDGYGVHLCPSIARARETADTDTAAFIIDYHLARGETGVELVFLIRDGQTGAPTNTPVIVTSGDERCREAALKVGADVFLLKPYGPSILTAELSKLTGKDN